MWENGKQDYTSYITDGIFMGDYYRNDIANYFT